MTSTVRSRLWLTYVLVIVFIITIVIAGILISLVRNPIIRQSSNVRLLALSQSFLNRTERILLSDPSRLDQALIREARARNVRVLLVDDSGEILVDSAGADAPRIIQPIPAERFWDGAAFTLTDGAGGVWTAMLRPLSNGAFLALLLDRPRFPLANLVRNDVLAPIILAGIIALFLALFVSLAISHWITHPLREMATVARSSRGENSPRMRIAGPSEVQEVALAFNDLLARVESSQRSQRDFLANVSHELKTPLTSIQGFAHAIRDGALDDDASVKNAGSVIVDECDRMNRLVMQLIELSRLESGVARIDFQSTDIAAIIRNLVARHRMHAEEKDISIDLQLVSIPLIEADGDQMSQVFGNLIDNAVKFTPIGGRVLITLTFDSTSVIVSVIDNGPGIHQEDLPRIFERFYQIDTTRRGDQERGVGLGLAIARQIVLSHQGEINVVSDTGQGASFIVRLPIRRNALTTLGQ